METYILQGTDGQEYTVEAHNRTIAAMKLKREVEALSGYTEEALMQLMHYVPSAEETEHERLIDGLTHADEDKLKEAHAQDYTGTDDDMCDAFEDWLMEQSVAYINKVISK